jgi:hypothetical protein
MATGEGGASALAVPAGFLADALVLLHFGFVLFVAAGALLVLRWPRLAVVHIPAAIWGAWIEFTGGICPLTPLEKSLRAQAGEASYAGDFVGHYILPVLYPAGLGRSIQLVLGTMVVLTNLVIYGVMLRRHLAPDLER